jgi:hypothetical protein
VGKVTLAVDYDAADSPPTTKIQISSYQSASSTSVWDKCTNTSTISNLHKFGTQRYVRSGTVTGDIKTYDVGKLYVATANTPTSATNVGEVWVDYTIDFFTPQIATGTTLNLRKSKQPQQTSIISKTPTGIFAAVHIYNEIPLYVINGTGSDSARIAFNPAIQSSLTLFSNNTKMDWRPCADDLKSTAPFKWRQGCDYRQSDNNKYWGTTASGDSLYAVTLSVVSSDTGDYQTPQIKPYYAQLALVGVTNASSETYIRAFQDDFYDTRVADTWTATETKAIYAQTSNTINWSITPLMTPQGKYYFAQQHNSNGEELALSPEQQKALYNHMVLKKTTQTVLEAPLYPAPQLTRRTRTIDDDLSSLCSELEDLHRPHRN